MSVFLEQVDWTRLGIVYVCQFSRILLWQNKITCNLFRLIQGLRLLHICTYMTHHTLVWNIPLDKPYFCYTSICQNLFTKCSGLVLWVLIYCYLVIYHMHINKISIHYYTTYEHYILNSLVSATYFYIWSE